MHELLPALVMGLYAFGAIAIACIAAEIIDYIDHRKKNLHKKKSTHSRKVAYSGTYSNHIIPLRRPSVKPSKYQHIRYMYR